MKKRFTLFIISFIILTQIGWTRTDNHSLIVSENQGTASYGFAAQIFKNLQQSIQQEMASAGMFFSSGTVSSRINANSDDAEERGSDGLMDLNSSDLELIADTPNDGDQIVGLRFTSINIPQGATITNAYIEFEVDEADSGATSLIFSGEDVDNANTFSSATNNISSRISTSNTVSWNSVAAWNTVNQKKQTPDLSVIIQEIVDRGGWSSGNSLVIMVTGSGERTAESYNGENANAPLLVVDYSTVATFSCGTGIISNPDFEAGLSNWNTVGSTTFVTNNAYYGTKAVVVDGSDGGVEQSFAATPGNVYSLSAYAKKSGTADPFLGLEFYNSSWGYISGFHNQITTTSYEYSQLSMTAPANTAYVMFAGRNNSGNGDAYFDSFCTDEFVLTAPTCNNASCDLSTDGNYEMMVLDDSGNSTHTSGYDSGNLVLCDKGNGTIGINGTIVSGRDAAWHASDGSPCGLDDAWEVDLTLSDMQTWAEFGGAYEVNGTCDNHTSYDYWDIEGTFTGIGCNTGRTLTIRQHQNGYRLQVGYGGNTHSCGFGISTWFEGDENGTDIAGDIYAMIDENCYAAMRPNMCSSTNVLTNAEFDDGTTDWFIIERNNVTVALSDDNNSELSGTNSALVDITAATGTHWDIRVGQGGKSIEIGKTYTLSFDAKATANRSMSMLLELGVSPYTQYWIETINLTTTATTYEFDFGVHETAVGNVNLMFNLGASAENVYLDDISFSEKKCVEICDNGIDDDNDGLVDCDDPDCSLVNKNGGLETNNGNFAFATTLESNPAQKIYGGETEFPGWGPALTSDCSYYVDDTANTVNNPEGDYFVWLSSMFDCFISLEHFSVLGLVDGEEYTLSFHVASWNISLDSSCDPDGAAVNQHTGSVNIDYEHNYDFTTVGTYNIPLSSSWSDLTWKKIKYTFTYNAATLSQHRFGITNASNYGMALDNIIFSKTSCVPVDVEICDNNIDDDFNGITDLDCICTGDEVTAVSQSNTGVSNPGNAVGLADLAYADLRGGDVLTLDLGENIPEGENIQIHLTRGNTNGQVTVGGSLNETTGYSGSIVWGNPSNGSTTYPATYGPTYFEAIDFTVPTGGMRYIRFVRNSGQLRIDGVRYCSSSSASTPCSITNDLTNSEFDNGTADWFGYSNGGSTSSTFSVDNTSQLSGTNSALIDISSTSGTNWHVQLGQSGKSIENGTTYTVSFDAKAVANRDIYVMLQMNGSPYTEYWNTTVPLTTTGTSYSFDFTANATITNNLNLVFSLGETTDNVYIDNVLFGETCSENEICGNGIDDDGDMLIDSDDPDCINCPTGSIYFERFNGISGSTIADLTGSANYPNTPTETGTFNSFEGPTNYTENYGTRIRGFIHPTETGNYIFTVTSDDASEVYLSTDDSPNNKTKIADITGWTASTDFTKYPSQTSSNIALTAGQRYYVEVLHKEGNGGDNLALYWQTPSNSTRTVISGTYLSSWVCESSSEICDNGIDDDQDGLIDEADPDCVNNCLPDCNNPYAFNWFNGTSGEVWEITNGEASVTRTYTLSGGDGDYDVSVTLDNPDGQNIDFSNCGTAGNHFYTATCNDPNATANCDGDSGTADGQFDYGCGYLTFGVTSNNSNERTSITYSFERPTQICNLLIGDIDSQGSGLEDLKSWQDEIDLVAENAGTPVNINADAGSNVIVSGNNTSSLNLLSTYTNTACCNLDQNDPAGHASVTTLGKVTSITITYSNGPNDDGLSDDHAIRLSGFDICPSPPEICDNGIDDDEDGLIDCADPDCNNDLNVTAALAKAIICNGETTTLSASATGGDGNYTFSWDNSLVDGNSHSINPTENTIYNVTITDGNGCEATDQISIAVNNCPEICGNGIDDDNDGLVDNNDPDCMIFQNEWAYDCTDGLCSEIEGQGIKGSTRGALEVEEIAEVQFIVVEATFSGGSGSPDQVTFSNSNGETVVANKQYFDGHSGSSGDRYFQAELTTADSVFVDYAANATSRAESFVAYVFRDCEDQSSVGKFTHQHLSNESYTFSFNIPTSNQPRDILIEVPLSEITNDGRLANVSATAGGVSKMISIDAYNQGNSLNITPFTLENVPATATVITITVESPSGGQSLYLSGAATAKMDCDAALTVLPSTNVDCAEEGQSITYTYSIFNYSDHEITNITASDALTGNINLGLTSLLPGQNMGTTSTYTVQAADFPGPLQNAITITGTDAVTTEIITKTFNIDVPLIASSLTITADRENATIGDTITYTYQIDNLGTSGLVLDLTDDLIGNILDLRATDGLQVLYTFDEGSGGIIRDVSGVGSPLDLSIESPANTTWGSSFLSVNSETRATNLTESNKVHQSCTASNEVSLEVWVKPTNNSQDGPARMLSYSLDSSNRNVQLSQQNNDYNGRLRTTNHDRNELNGTGNHINGAPVWQHVVYTYDGTEAKIYVNGVHISDSGEDTPTGNFSTWNSSYTLVLFNEYLASRAWLGDMGLAAIYSKALSQAEVTQNYDLGYEDIVGYLAAGESLTWTSEYIVQESDFPSPLTNQATLVATSEEGCTVTVQDDVDVRLCTNADCIEYCHDGIDNDGDGLTDCDDDDCVSITDGGTIEGAEKACGIYDPMAITAADVPSNHNGNTIYYEWERSTDFGYSWIIISGAVSESFDPFPITISTRFRRKARLFDCDPWEISNVIIKKVVGEPTALNDNFDSCPGVVFSQNVRNNDVDIDNPSFSITATPSSGSVTIDNAGEFTYTPSGVNCAVDQFSYQICNDETSCCDIATVTINLADGTAPNLVNVPADITLECDATIPELPLVLAIDNCPAISITNEEVSTQTETGCSRFSYTITRTWLAADFCGNDVSESQIITVQDTIPPTFTPPASAYIPCSEDKDDLSTTGDVLDELDNCSTNLQAVYTDNLVHLDTAECRGYIIRNWTLTDVCGNTSAADQYIYIFDDTDRDKDGTPDALDLDDDNDGIPDVDETYVDTDGDGITNNLDLDSDNDGIPDILEAGFIDSNGDGVVDNLGLPGWDDDGDGFADGFDANDMDTSLVASDNFEPLSPIRDRDGDNITNFWDLDSDNDGVGDLIESGGVDTNGDGIIDYPVISDPTSMIDVDGDGFVDIYDPDNDGNPGTESPNQPLLIYNGVEYTDGANIKDHDSDTDDIPDLYDLDCDNDGISDLIEAGAIDMDGDGKIDLIGEFEDTNSDGFHDNYSALSLMTTDLDGETIDGRPEDDDADGTPYNGCDLDKDGIPNQLDVESDGDGILDIVEIGNAVSDADLDGRLDNTTDVDKDGFDDNLAALGFITTDSDGLTDDGRPEDGLDTNASPFSTSSADGSLGETNGETDIDDDGDGSLNFLDLDSDGDLIPDVVEDTNQNGIQDPGETGAYDSDSDDDMIRDGTEDTNINGIFEPGETDPLNPNTDGDLLDDGVEDANQNGSVNFGESDPRDPCDPFLNESCIGIALNIKIKLQGALMGNSSDTLMRDDLRMQGVLPLKEPYLEMDGFAHRGTGGGEVVDTSLLMIDGPNAIVDWVLVELRDPVEPGNILATRSALLQRDGDVVDTSGLAPLWFPEMPSGNYYVAVRHRNHLGVMTYGTYILSPQAKAIDFTKPETLVYGGLEALYQLGNRRHLWAGDINSDHKVIYQGPQNDILNMFLQVLTEPGNVNYYANYVSYGYQNSDVNMDGKTIYQGPGNDRSKMLIDIVLKHVGNTAHLANYAIWEQMPQ